MTKQRQNFVFLSKKLQLDLITKKFRPQYLSKSKSRLAIQLRIIDCFFIQIEYFSLRQHQRVFEKRPFDKHLGRPKSGLIMLLSCHALVSE